MLKQYFSMYIFLYIFIKVIQKDNFLTTSLDFSFLSLIREIILSISWKIHNFSMMS